MLCQSTHLGAHLSKPVAKLFLELMNYIFISDPHLYLQIQLADCQFIQLYFQSVLASPKDFYSGILCTPDGSQMAAFSHHLLLFRGDQKHFVLMRNKGFLLNSLYLYSSTVHIGLSHRVERTPGHVFFEHYESNPSVNAPPA